MGFFRGGRIHGDECVGDCWELKDQIGEKKNSRGPEIFGGDFWGKCKKGVEKLFWGVLGSYEPPKILGGNFWKNVKEKNLGGKFWG